MPEEAWEPYGEPHPEEIRECAEVPFVAGEKSEHKETEPLRYVGIRIRKRHGGLFEGGLATRHFALVSNIWDWKAGRLMEWHRENAGTIEAVHDVVKRTVKRTLETLIAAETQGGYTRHGPPALTSRAPDPVITAFAHLISELGTKC